MNALAYNNILNNEFFKEVGRATFRWQDRSDSDFYKMGISKTRENIKKGHKKAFASCKSEETDYEIDLFMKKKNKVIKLKNKKQCVESFKKAAADFNGKVFESKYKVFAKCREDLMTLKSRLIQLQKSSSGIKINDVHRYIQEKNEYYQGPEINKPADTVQ